MKQAPNQRPSEERGSTEASRPNVPLKVLYLITKATRGGAQKYVYDLATNLPKEGFEPFVAYGERGVLADELEKAGIKTGKLASLGRDIAVLSDIKSFFEIRSAIRKISPDIVHLNSSKAAALGALCARIGGVQKIIFTVHGWPFKERKNIFWRAFAYLVSWLTALLASDIIVVSETDKTLGARMGFAAKTHLIPLGLVPAGLLSPADAFKTMFGRLPPAAVGNVTLRLVSIGELTPNKGLRYAIDAVAALSERGLDAVYVIAGEGEERGTLELQAKKRGVADRVFFPGFIENAAQNLSGFDAFVLPSLKEGTPYVLLEAASAGIPIIATSVIDAEFARTLRLRIVPPGDSLALADAIAETAKAPRVPQSDVNRFSLAVMLAKTTTLYR